MIDIWSFGCILAELYTGNIMQRRTLEVRYIGGKSYYVVKGLMFCLFIAGYPLFPGENEVEQLACMMEVLGVPPRSALEQASRKKMFFGKEFKYLCYY